MRKALPSLLIASAVVLMGCAALQPRPGPARAMAPRPNPPASAEAASAASGLARIQARVRRNPWLVRFWEELSPAQRRRVLAAIRRAGGPERQEEAAARWDVMGLPERAQLVFGDPAPPPAHLAISVQP